MKIISLFSSSVDNAVRSVSKALSKLEKAEAKHINASENFAVIAKTAQGMAVEEAAKADRANRIKEKLAALLA